jgi:hypothetical protein
VESTEVNGTKPEHHHHKKSRSSKKEEKEASSDDKKSRDKKKRKKSKEHDKKKSKKDRKEKKASATPEVQAKTPEKEPQKEQVVDATDAFNRSDSILDINLDDEWIGAAPEVSKWEREENNKSLENSEVDLDVKKGEDKVTSEVIKRAEHVLFTKAISAIRPKSPANASSESQVVAKGSIKNRLGKKITESSRSRTPPPPLDRGRKRVDSPDRKGKQLSSCIRVSNDSRDGRKVERKRTRTPEERRPRRSRTPPRYQRPTTSDKNASKAVVKKHSRSSSSSSGTTNSGETNKRHGKHKVKKRSRSPSADSSGKATKKRKKDKKRKKEKKSKKEKDKSERRDRD